MQGSTATQSTTAREHLEEAYRHLREAFGRYVTAQRVVVPGDSVVAVVSAMPGASVATTQWRHGTEDFIEREAVAVVSDLCVIAWCHVSATAVAL